MLNYYNSFYVSIKTSLTYVRQINAFLSISDLYFKPYAINTHILIFI